MMLHFSSRLLAWALGLLAVGVAAQPAVEAGPARLSYNSPLVAYRAWTDQPVQSWRDANAHVGRIGGWRTYSREAATGYEPATAAPKGEAAAASAPGHRGHIGHSHGGAMGARP